MEQIVVIFNGIKVPDHLVNAAISKAKEHGTALLALFLAGEKRDEGYIFPSDLDAAQDDTDADDAERADMRVIRSKMKVLEGTAKFEGVHCTTELLFEPGLEQVTARIGAAQLVLVDANYETDLNTITSFDIEDLLERLPNVEKVGA